MFLLLMDLHLCMQRTLKNLILEKALSVLKI
jgi:hypothetical protein